MTRALWYVLNPDNSVRPAVDQLEGARAFGDRDRRRVAQDVVTAADGTESKVSTVFLGLDHSFSENEAPVLFETMVFGGPMNEEMDRYCTWADAVAGHVRMVARVRAEVEAGPDTEDALALLAELRESRALLLNGDQWLERIDRVLARHLKATA